MGLLAGKNIITKLFIKYILKIYGNFQRNRLDEKTPKKPFLKNLTVKTGEKKTKPTVYVSRLATNGNLF